MHLGLGQKLLPLNLKLKYKSFKVLINAGITNNSILLNSKLLIKTQKKKATQICMAPFKTVLVTEIIRSRFFSQHFRFRNGYSGNRFLSQYSIHQWPACSFLRYPEAFRCKLSFRPYLKPKR